MKAIYTPLNWDLLGKQRTVRRMRVLTTALLYIAHAVLYGVNLPFLFEIFLT